jgi:hypothetical protein
MDFRCPFCDAELPDVVIPEECPSCRSELPPKFVDSMERELPGSDRNSKDGTDRHHKDW